MAQLSAFTSFNAQTLQAVFTFDTAISAADGNNFYAAANATDTSTLYPLTNAAISGLGTTTLTFTIPLSTLSRVWANRWQAQANTYVYIPDGTLATTPAIDAVDPPVQAGSYTVRTTVPSISLFDYRTVDRSTQLNTINWNMRVVTTTPIQTIGGTFYIRNQAANFVANIAFTNTNFTSWTSANVTYIKFSNTFWNTLSNVYVVENSNTDTYVNFAGTNFTDVFGLQTANTTLQANSVTVVLPTGYDVATKSMLNVSGGNTQTVITTDGQGNLSWTAPLPGGNLLPPWTNLANIPIGGMVLARNDRSAFSIGAGNAINLSSNLGSWTQVYPGNAAGLDNSNVNNVSTNYALVPLYISSIAYSRDTNSLFAVGYPGGNITNSGNITANAFVSTDGGRTWQGRPRAFSQASNYTSIKYAAGAAIASSAGRDDGTTTTSLGYAAYIPDSPIANTVASTNLGSMTPGGKSVATGYSYIGGFYNYIDYSIYYNTGESPAYGIATVYLPPYGNSAAYSWALNPTVSGVQTYKTQLSATPQYWGDIAAGDGLFVAVAGRVGGSNMAVYTPTVHMHSTANVNALVGYNWATPNSWPVINLPSTQTWSLLEFGNQRFVAVPTTGAVSAAITSGTIKSYAASATWTQGGNGLPSTAAWSSLKFGGGFFYLSSLSSNIIYQSADGVSWTAAGTAPFANVRTLGYNEQEQLLFAASGSPGPPPVGLRSIAYGANTYVIVGDAGTIVTSTDLNNFTQQTNPNNQQLNGIFYSTETSTFVAVGTNAVILTSTNGINWTQRAQGNTRTLNSVYYGNGRWIAVGSSYVGTSVDNGVTWQQQVYAPFMTNTQYDVAYGNGVYVMTCSTYNFNFGVWTSPSGGTYYTSTTTGTTITFASTAGLSLGLKIWCVSNTTPYFIISITATTIQVSLTPNGAAVSLTSGFVYTDWAPYNAFSPQSGLGSGICWDGTQFIAGSTYQDMAYSTDGRNWTYIVSGFNSTNYNATATASNGNTWLSTTYGTYTTISSFNVSLNGGALQRYHKNANTQFYISQALTSNDGFTIANPNNTSQLSALQAVQFPVVANNIIGTNPAITNSSRFFAIGSILSGSQITLTQYYPYTAGALNVTQQTSGANMPMTAGTIWTATNTWGILNSVKYLNNTFVTVGSGGSLAYSTDGINWQGPKTIAYASVPNTLYGFTLGNSLQSNVATTGTFVNSGHLSTGTGEALWIRYS